MSDIVFEPFAASVVFQSQDSRSIPEWTAILKGLLEKLASLCVESGASVIGHIKGLSLVGQDHYIRVSVVSHMRPAEIETNALGAYTNISLSLNILVYGLPLHTLERILQQAVSESLVPDGVTVTATPRPSTHRKIHDHHDHQ